MAPTLRAFHGPAAHLGDVAGANPYGQEVDTLIVSYSGRLGLVQRLVALLQDDGVTRVNYQGPTDAADSDADKIETVLLGVPMGAGPETLTHVRAVVEEFLRRHQGVSVSVEQDTTPDPSHGAGLVAELESLARLHSEGHLSDEEFQRAKTLLLGNE